MSVSPVPEGYHTVISYLVVEDAARALAFYAEAFGAEEMFRLPMTRDGREQIGHAEMRIGDTVLMLSDEWPDMNYLGPKRRGGPSTGFVIYGPDVDARFQRALNAGATVVQPVADQFWGDRMGTVKDPFGHSWTLGTHIEDVPTEELQSRMRLYHKAQDAQANVT